MENKHSSDGIAEDMIRSFVQTGCAEIHAKTLLEKYQAQLENGLIDVTNPDIVQAQLEKIDDTVQEIASLAQLRRGIMLRLFEMYDGDKDYWCEVKHLGIGAYTLFEAYQASADDPTLLNLATEANKRFIKALTRFLGIPITECASCFSDILKAQKEIK